MIDRSSKIARCAPLLGFQNDKARRWLGRAQGFDDPFVRFFLSFSGFNALYFAWARVDDLRNRKGTVAGKGLQIKNLLQEPGSEEVERILDLRRQSWAFKFNLGQKLRALFGWSSSYRGPL